MTHEGYEERVGRSNRLMVSLLLKRDEVSDWGVGQSQGKPTEVMDRAHEGRVPHQGRGARAGPRERRREEDEATEGAAPRQAWRGSGMGYLDPTTKLQT